MKEGKAKPDFRQDGKPVVTLEMKDPNKFGEVTTELAKLEPRGKNILVIWLDFEEGVDSYQEEIMKPNPAFVSAPHIDKPIHSANVEISGSFTVRRNKRTCWNFKCRGVTGSA